jgi:PhnB protein
MSNTQTTIVQPVPYLSFGGNCAEAVRYYEKILHGNIKVLMTQGEMPGGDQFPKEDAHLVMNATLELPGGGVLMAGDAPGHMGPHQGFKGFSLALTFPTDKEGEAIFNAFAAEGTVIMPYEPTFWADKFGMVTDKFGIDWLINGNLHQM